MPDASRRFAWCLVCLYPPRFRRDVGLALVDTIEDRMRERRDAGKSAVSVRLSAVADTVRNLPGAWISAIASARGERAAEPIARGRSPMENVAQDVRYALRLWKRRPGFALVAILTLALGVGANTAMFSIVNAVLLRPLPYADAERLVSVTVRTPSSPRSLVSFDEYSALAQERNTFDVAALWLGQSVNLTGVAEPQRILGNFVTGTFFDVLQLGAERGRLFRESESLPGSAQHVVVISHKFWERRFNRDPEIIGKPLTLNGTPMTVIGVLKDPFDMNVAPADGWFIDYDVFIPVGLFPMPTGVSQATLNAAPSMLAIARLKQGVRLETANASLDLLSRRLQTANPSTQRGRTAFCVSAQDELVGDSRVGLLLLFAAVVAVLVIACLNVSNLLMARAIDRQREIAVRSALGASRAAVTRQLAIEAAMLGSISAAMGLLLGRWWLQGLSWLRPPTVPIPDRIPLDSRVLLFTVVSALTVAIVCGLAPSLRAARPDLTRAFQAGHRSTASGRRIRDVFVVFEIAMSLVLIGLSGLMIRSMLALQNVDLGFDTRSVFTLQFRLPATKYRTPDEIARFFSQTIARIRSVPGIESAALVRRVPISGNWGDTPFTVEGRDTPAGAPPRAGQNIVTPDYFRTMRIPLVRGRDFTDRDDLQALPVAVVNEMFARTIFPAEDPIGKRVKIPDFKEPLTVIGVVGNVKHRTPTEPAQPQLYVAHYQLPMIFTSLVARTAVPPLTLTQDIRRAVWSVDKDQLVWSIATLETIVGGARASTRFLALLLGIFACVALLLGSVGIYGVMSYAVTERTHEIGVRMALGASSSRVMREIVGRSVTLTAIALVIGVPSAITLGRVSRGVLFGVAPYDATTFVAAAGVLGLVSVLAAYLPARRAARVDPVVALAEQ